MPHVTLYRGDRDAMPVLRDELTWDEFCAAIRDACEEEEAEKDDLLAFAPHRLAETCACGKCDGGPHRLLKNVEAVTMLVLDIDKGPARDPEAFLTIARNVGIQVLIYESPSSAEGDLRLRVCAPVSREISVAECRRSRFLFAELMGLSPGCGVEGAKDAAKIFFVGRKPGTPARRVWST